MLSTIRGVATAHSSLTDSSAAAREVLSAIPAEGTALLIFFASSSYDLGIITQTLQAALPETLVIGCTTAGELVSGQGSLKQSLVAMALPRTVITRAEGILIENLADRAKSAGEDLRALASRWGKDVRTLDPSRFVGLVLPDGLSLMEEALMDALGDAAPDLLVVGGSAGDDLKFTGTYVALGEKSATNASVLVMLEVGVPFTVVKNTHFVPTERMLVATRVDEATRTVYEFDGRPALEAYAEALGISPEAVDVPVMAANPVGLVIGDDPFVRSFMRLGENGSMILAAQILEGSILTLLRGTDMVEATRRLAADVQQELGAVSAAITFNCIFRWVEAEGQDCASAVYKVFDEQEIPLVGFNTYGEQYLGHINQTVTMLCFGG